MWLSASWLRVRPLPLPLCVSVCAICCKAAAPAPFPAPSAWLPGPRWVANAQCVAVRKLVCVHFARPRPTRPLGCASVLALCVGAAVRCEPVQVPHFGRNSAV